MRNSGFRNEDVIRKALNENNIQEINENLRNNLIYELYPEIRSSEKILCEKIGGQSKPDIKITINNKLFFISIKSGKGCEVHQEPLDSFINYLINNTNINNKEIDCVRLFIWADGTLDGKGKVEDRKNIKKLAQHFPDERDTLQNYFDLNRNKIIERLVETGKDANLPNAEYIFYGHYNDNFQNSFTKTIDNVKDFLSSNKSAGTLNIGKLSFQAWNPVLNGRKDFEHRRGSMQSKWGPVGRDMNNIEK